MSVAPYPCPCCGHLVLAEPPGSFDICPVCFWEDDQVQLRWPDYEGGANKPSLIQSQRNFGQHRAIEERFAATVRAPRTDEPIEDGWRPIDLDLDDFEPRDRPPSQWPADLTVMYWWRPTFWRRDPTDGPPGVGGSTS